MTTRLRVVLRGEMKAFDVLIVGAGIVGCAAARECAASGLRVGLIDGGIGTGTGAGSASAAGMGHLVVMDDSPAQLALTRHSRELWRQVRPRLPAAAEYESCGTIWVAADDEEMNEVQAKQRVFAACGVDSEVLEPAVLAREEPNLRRSLAGGLLVPDDGVIYPPAATAYFLDEAVRLGAEVFRSRVEAAALGEVVLGDGSRLRGERIVLASGADCALLPNLPVQRRKGHLVITDRYAGFVRHQLLELGYLKSAHSIAEDSVAFNVQPRQTGQLLIGSSRQFGSESGEVEPAMMRRMLERACAYMPGLAMLSALRVWTGFRAATPDKLPMIGPATGFTDDSSLWLTMGYEGLGITNAPAAAELLVDALLERRSRIDRTPYLPSRMMQIVETTNA